MEQRNGGRRVNTHGEYIPLGCHQQGRQRDGAFDHAAPINRWPLVGLCAVLGCFAAALCAVGYGMLWLEGLI